MNIFLIEDNDIIIKGLKYAFKQHNYYFFWAKNIKDAQKFLESNSNIDLIILDIALPDGNGFDFFEKVIVLKQIPTLFLTAQDEEDIIVKSLNLGAEDYLKKPFSTKELLARINKIFLRNKKDSILQVQDISFDLEQMQVLKGKKKIELTALELKLLQLLFININKVVYRQELLDAIWDITGNDVDDHTLTVYFKRIRAKLGTDIITTIKGIGYEIKNEK